MMNKQTYIDIRSKVSANLPKETVSFFFSGVGVRRSADADYPFSSNRNFTYLTGIEEPEAVLVMDGEPILFIRDIDPFKEKWFGYFITVEKAQDISGISDVRFLSEFEAYVETVLARDVKIGVDLDHDTYSDVAHGSGVMFASTFESEDIVNVFDVVRDARMVKLPEEVEAIKHALDVTNTAILASLNEMKPGNNENDIASRFHYEAHRAQGDLMFDTIMASGSNAVVLHYIENNQELKDGELVLFDLGVRVNKYGGDISRTFPINGKFTDRQREIYQAVLDCFHAVNAAIRPGISILDLNELAKEKLAQSCKALGLLESTSDIDKFYYHGIGHSLGLDTHDVWGDRSQKLVVGNVITNEPGLYIASEGIGIRIETDVLVTESGCIDLAPQIIREVDDIESYLAQR